ncbi:protein-L-isoaspartate(D-aspartate) O-methyltransferase [Flavobacteriaceae bacterium TP-CH-4]|uniref:Protein-L-isoaspartate O-methyltransferase n=1 Tax=Pelagihabitans pacificus TaxID=2696054 RepID=A0A967AVI2_9FLAO|nr:protein-L-isoaspartate(D-aspartate) O-methyltransferase [Pelagihabitans pacificus]NHF59935.1 protein-L-isoaspartate(D-aspartate) O-methyltransferase [Pelagihabitans pacificus]
MSKTLLTVTIVLFIGCGTLVGQTDFATQKEQMVRIQLQGRDITDIETLSALLNVRRHEFVPENLKNLAYTDGPLPIGNGQTISQPYIVAFMTQALRLKSNHRVLEIGTGSGYQAAVLAKIVDSVYTIEIVKDLATTAEKRLKRLGYDNVNVKWGDGYHGWPSKAPFDAVMVTAGADSIPQPLIDQLKVGGRMIIPVGPHHGVRQLVLITKKKNEVRTKSLMAVRFVPFTRKDSIDPDR